MNPLKKLVGQTAVYGLSSIIGRILGYLLVPIYTRVLAEEIYGEVAELYSYIALILIVLTYGMETSFFRFAKSTGDRQRVFGTAFVSIFTTSIFFLLLISIYKQGIADIIQYAAKPEYIIYVGLILFFDSINTIPYANLRLEDRAKRFVAIRLIGILSNVVLIVLFILVIPFLISKYGDNSLVQWISKYYDGDNKIDYILFNLYSYN